MSVQTYLQFEGHCEDAIRFYTRAIGAEVQMMMRHRESPEPAPPGMLPADSGEKIMHAAFKVGDSVLLATDGRCSGKPSFQGFSLNISAADEAEARGVFARLSDGGQVTMPLTKTFWSPAFGLLVDRFGVSWMVMVPA
jgi:PhnB protein